MILKIHEKLSPHIIDDASKSHSKVETHNSFSRVEIGKENNDEYTNLMKHELKNRRQAHTIFSIISVTDFKSRIK